MYASSSVVRVGALTIALTIGTAAGAQAQPSAYGVVTHDMDANRAVSMAELGAGFARISFRWWQLEPSPGAHHWATMDDYVWNQAAPRTIRLFASLGEPPEWAGGGPQHNRRPADLARWYDFVFACVTRYRGYIGHWGIWNEPNLSQFLENRDDYRDIALVAAQAIRDADPTARVLGPEVSEHAFDDGYLAEVMSTYGRHVFDIVTVHVYSTDLARKMDDLVYPWRYGKEVWVTEIGRTARPGDATSEELQRLYYLAALNTFEPRRWWWTKLLFYDIWAWSWTESLYGLRRPDWTPNRAFGSYRDWILGQPVVTPATDSDGDGMSDDWEGQRGLNPRSAAGHDGAAGDPDGDGVTNLEEMQRQSHPRGFHVRYLAEGASASPFSTTFALLNTSTSGAARVVLRFLKEDGTVVSRVETVPKGARRTVDAASVLGTSTIAFSTVIESDVMAVVDRTMRWGGALGGAHGESSVAAPSTSWFLAEGATHSGFELFYLLQNSSTTWANVTITYLRPAPLPAIARSYSVAPLSRQNVWVNLEEPALAGTDVSASIVSDVPIIVERAMYRGRSGGAFVAGHESAGVTAPATSWFLAEGATGRFFDLYVLLANGTDQVADVSLRFLRPDGITVTRAFPLGPRSRQTVWVDHEDPALADTAVSTVVESTNGVPIVAERAMWWPGPTAASWHEAHNSPGSTVTGTTWAVADGEAGGPRAAETYLLIANTSTSRLGLVRVTLYLENGTQLARTFSVLANSRFNVNVGAEFPAAAGRRFGAVVESLGPGPAPIVVERAVYESGGVRVWNAGTNALATRIQ
jgi:hypothetical protein